MTPESIALKVARLPHGEGLEMPAYATDHAAGADLRAAVTEPLVVPPGTLVLVPTGLVMAVPIGYEVQIRPRSGLAAKHRIGLLNSPGTIDADYRGELKIILMNFGSEPFTIERGDRIAQMVIAPVLQAAFQECAVDELSATDRGTGGFGSTGRR